MEGNYQSSIPPLVAYYPNGYPPTMPPEGLQQPQSLHQMQSMAMENLGAYSDYDDPNRAMLPPQGPQRSRRRQPHGAEHVKHRRTRSGCYTCRQRRVKCDETHPVCERCRKGKRECTYPGVASTAPSSFKSRHGAKGRGSSAGSTPSGSDTDFDDKEPLSAIQDIDGDGSSDGEDPQSATRSSRKPSDTSSFHPDQCTSPHTEASAPLNRSQSARSNSKQSIQFGIIRDPRWPSLPKDVRYYLTYHREHMSHHHYAFKYDDGDFLRTTFLEVALNDGSAALLYAIVAFAAYHHSVERNDGNIATFLSYYNKSIAFLQQSLKRQRHNVATLLTILQLATIEEFLGDWVNLLGHQKAAHQILIDLFTPQTIMQDETRRKIIAWYTRFDLFVGMMAGGVPALERTWFSASADFYQRSSQDNPNDLGARFEEYFATSRLLAADVMTLFDSNAKNAISDEQFAAGVEKLSVDFAEFSRTIATAFIDPSCFVKSFPDTSAEGDEDLFDFRDPNFLYAGELSTMNFVLLDQWAIELMFKYQVTLLTGQAPSVDLTEIAMKKCKMFDAIQYGGEGGPTAVLGAQASLGIQSLFLPKEMRYTMWCRRKFARIEQLGYIYPTTFQKRMTDLWGVDVTHWWLPNDESYPSTIRALREFVEYRATRPSDAWTTGISNMSGVFRTLGIDDHGYSDDLRSAGTGSIHSSTSPQVQEISPEQLWPQRSKCI